MHSYHSTKNNPRFHPRKLWVSGVIIAMLTVFCGVASAGDLYIKDGDSFVLNGEEIRLWGVDAMELSQTCQKSGRDYPCGQFAKSYLLEFIGGHELRCEKMPAAKKETRTVARCFVGDLDIGREMVRAGWAIDYRYFSKGFYAEAETYAREQKRGVWEGRFQTPRNWRKSNPYR